MMLPEHREALAKHKNAAAEKQETPCIDEDQLELWERLLRQSYRGGRQITVRALYRNKICTVTGVAREPVPGKGLLLLATDSGEKKVKISETRSIE